MFRGVELVGMNGEVRLRFPEQVRDAPGILEGCHQFGAFVPCTIGLP